MFWSDCEDTFNCIKNLIKFQFPQRGIYQHVCYTWHNQSKVNGLLYTVFNHPFTFDWLCHINTTESDLHTMAPNPISSFFNTEISRSWEVIESVNGGI